MSNRTEYTLAKKVTISREDAETIESLLSNETLLYMSNEFTEALHRRIKEALE